MSWVTLAWQLKVIWEKYGLSNVQAFQSSHTCKLPVYCAPVLQDRVAVVSTESCGRVGYLIRQQDIGLRGTEKLVREGRRIFVLDNRYLLLFGLFYKSSYTHFHSMIGIRHWSWRLPWCCKTGFGLLFSIQMVCLFVSYVSCFKVSILRTHDG